MRVSWVTRCAASILFVSLATCTPIDTRQSLQGRQAGAGGIVSGIAWRDADGRVPLRREIHDLKDNHPDQWNLYLLGLSSLQKTDQNDPVSFYGIAGIHGRPFKVWQNASGLPHKVGTASYCPHGNTLFFGWHRPYLALFEQSLYEHIQRIISKAPADRIERYRSSADSFRIPYWDWGLGEKGGPVPDAFMTPNITIIDVDGSEKPIKNPLYSYTFNPLVPGDFDSKWAYMNETSRWPEKEDDPNAPSRNNMFADDFIGLQRTYVDGLEKVFRETDFNSFGQQLEQVHGWIHGTVAGGYYEEKGGQGHMWPLDYSAYDPLFWLHHTNIDRLFALYQAQYPDRYITPRSVFTSGNVFLDDGSIVDGNTPLLPFRKDASRFWTTNDIRDTAVFGYAYPETQPWNYNSSTEYQAAVSATVAQLYGGSVRARLTSQGVRTAGARLGSGSANNTFTDWMITTRAAAGHVPATFVAKFFLAGDGAAEQPAAVGMWTVLMPLQHGGEKRAVRLAQKKASRQEQDAQDKMLEGSVGLTASLLDSVNDGQLASLEPRHVVSFLKDRLTWKVYAGDGKLIPQPELGAMEVLVVSTSAHVSEDPGLPIEYGDVVTPHPEVTAGKRGGGGVMR